MMKIIFEQYGIAQFDGNSDQIPIVITTDLGEIERTVEKGLRILTRYYTIPIQIRFNR